jgi:cytoskeletal protein RodZ
MQEEIRGEISWRRGVSIGDTLAEARRQAGLTITQVSQRTRIRESIIAAIERDDFSPCGGDFYARGHIRSIASVVGIDPAPLVREYDEEHGPPGGLRAAEVFEPATPIKIREPRRFRLGTVVAVLLLAAIGYGAYHLVSTHDAHASANATDTLRPAASPKPHPTAKPTPTQAPATQHAVASPPEAVIKLTAVRNCWVGLTNTSGKQVYQGLITAGNTMTWREQHPVNMVIGNPAGIELTVNGKTETPNSLQVVTVSINPSGKNLVSMKNSSGQTVAAVGAPSPAG